MAGTSLFALLDDIASLLDDISVMAKVAAKKTTGVLGDDLALNAQQVTGVMPDRELPVVWAVAKGSLINKAILVPAALGISVVAGFLITPLLMVGGSFLCFEGVEKVAHKLLHPNDTSDDEIDLMDAIADPELDLVAFEKQRIQGAIRTDFILSAEIVVITLGIVSESNFLTQIGVLAGISIVMTFGVYGLVAGIVKLDDVGLHLSQRQGAIAAVGRGILTMAPYLMKTLSIVGTIAMFLVGGGILVHGIPGAGDFVHDLAHHAAPLDDVVNSILGGIVGFIVGAIILAVVTGVQKLVKR